MIADGSIAVMKVGCQEAIRLRSWHLTTDQEKLGTLGITVSARVVSADVHWSTRPSFTLGLWMGMNWWLWRDVQVVSKGDIKEWALVELYAEGPPEAAADF